MQKIRKHIWIEAEEWADGEWDVEDTNTDVIVVFPDRSKWTASFFTYKNIKTLREKNKQTGECMNGAYFWSSDIVLIDIANRERIEQVFLYNLTLRTIKKVTLRTNRNEGLLFENNITVYLKRFHFNTHHVDNALASAYL